MLYFTIFLIDMLLETSDCDTLCFPDLETRDLKLFHKFLFESKPDEEEVKSQSELFHLIGVKLENYLASLGEFFCLFVFCLSICLSVWFYQCQSVCLSSTWWTWSQESVRVVSLDWCEIGKLFAKFRWVYRCVCLSVCPSVPLSVCLSVCPCNWR
jgi:hypothetical protein